MQISEREAARWLSGRGLSLSAAQHLLGTGIAGEPVRTGVATLYDADRVDELAHRPGVRADEFEDSFPGGVLIVRMPRDRTLAFGAAWGDAVSTLAGPWRVPFGKRFAVWATVRHAPGYPLLLSVAGHVIAGARIVGCSAQEDGRTVFGLEPPGSWLPPLLGRRLRGHRGAPVELVGWTAQGALSAGPQDP